MDISSHDIEILRQTTFVQAAITRAQARIEGMKAENKQCVELNRPINYGEDSFVKVITEEGLDQNSIVEKLFQIG